MEKTVDQQLVSLIVGEALATLAEVGADASILGSFALQFPRRLPQAMQVAAASPTPDLQKIVYEQVTQAIQDLKPQATQGSSKRQVTKNRINVVIAGRRTTVTIDRATMEQAAQACGPQESVINWIHDIASTTPASTPNKSAWVEEHLRRRAVMQSTPTTSALKH